MYFFFEIQDKRKGRRGLCYMWTQRSLGHVCTIVYFLLVYSSTQHVCDLLIFKTDR